MKQVSGFFWKSYFMTIYESLALKTKEFNFGQYFFINKFYSSSIRKYEQ